MAASAEDQHVSAEVARRPADEELEHVDHGENLSGWFADRFGLLQSCFYDVLLLLLYSY